jgi:thioredoxin 1
LRRFVCGNNLPYWVVGFCFEGLFFQTIVNDKQIMKTGVLELNEENFEREVLCATCPVVVEFWAGWSELCKATARMLESLDEADLAPVKIARVKIEHQRSLAEKYGVSAVPTLLIFSGGALQDQIVGRVDEREVKRRIAKFQLLPTS